MADIEVKEVTPPVEPVEKDEAPVLSELEQQAVAKGWKPLEDWVGNGGSEQDHRSAKEFLDRGELLDRIKDQSRELKSLGAIVGQLSEQNKQVYKAGYVRGLQDLNRAKAAAIKEGDGEAVVKIDQAIDQAQSAISRIDATPAAQQGPVGETEAFVDFKSRNAWFETDTKMKRWAYGTGMEYANQNPQASEAQVYAHVEKEIRKEFPEKFEQQRKGPPSPDGSSHRGTGKGSGDAASRSFEKVLANMPEDQARVARDMVRRGVVTKEKYAQDYEAIVSGR